METKHTKGNWTIVYPYGIDAFPGIDAIGKNGEGSFSVIVLGTKDELSGVQGRNNEEITANAKLIAAAPELLEYCIASYTVMRDNKKYFPKDKEEVCALLMESMERLIKKATE